MESMSYLASVIQTIAVVIATTVAVLGIRSWRRELLGKRRSEIAEQAIVAASSVRDAFAYVRSPFGFSNEGRTRNREDDRNTDLSETLDQDFVPIERMNKFLDEFSQLKSAKLLCQAHFGEEAAEPFDELFTIRSEIIGAARFRMMISGSNRQYNERTNELYIQKENIIWDQQEEDEINPRIEKAVSNIEKYYREFLKP